MAFKNVYLTDEEKAMLNEKKLPFPEKIYWRSRDDYFGNGKNYWTADPERSYYFCSCGEDRQEPEKEAFILVWKEFKLESMIVVFLEQHFRFNEEKKSVVNWKLRGSFVPNDVVAKREEISDVLKEALLAFGGSGDPDYPIDLKSSEEIIQFNF